MTTVITTIAAITTSLIPGFILSPHNPAAILGFAVVGMCLALVARDYVTPRRMTKHGVRL